MSAATGQALAVAPKSNVARWEEILPDVFKKAKLDFLTVQELYFKNCSPPEIRLGFAIIRETGLSPIARQIYFIARKQRLWNPDTRENEESYKMTIMVGIDGFRKISIDTGEMVGEDGPYWMGPESDYKWVDAWFYEAPPMAAKFGVKRKGWESYSYAVASYPSYCQRKDEYNGKVKTGRWTPSGQWVVMPDVMLSKCAEALAKRRVFPQQLGGFYEPSEMNRSGSDAEADFIQGEVLSDTTAPVDAGPAPETPKDEAPAAAPDQVEGVIEPEPEQPKEEPAQQPPTMEEMSAEITKICPKIWGQQTAASVISDNLREMFGTLMEDEPDCVALKAKGFVDFKSCSHKQLTYALNALRCTLNSKEAQANG